MTQSTEASGKWQLVIRREMKLHIRVRFASVERRSTTRSLRSGLIRVAGLMRGSAGTQERAREAGVSNLTLHLRDVLADGFGMAHDSRT